MYIWFINSWHLKGAVWVMQGNNLKKRHFIVLSAIIILTGLFCFSTPAWTDQARLYRQGETVRPINDNHVEMTAEEVFVSVGEESSTFDCRFTFKNTGPDQTVLMGFPEIELPKWVSGDPALHDFQAFIDGTPVAVKKEKAESSQKSEYQNIEISYSSFWAMEVPFKANEIKEVRNIYRVTNHRDVSNNICYILKTGSYWKGPIGKIRIVFHFENNMPPCEITRIIPGTYHFEGDDLVWEWTDLEPGGDINIYYHPVSLNDICPQ